MQRINDVFFCRRRVSGFTLIELTVVIAIIAILSAVALQAYNNQAARAANSACLSEAKTYANLAAMAFTIPDMAIPEPDISACQSIEKVTDISTPITAIPLPPGAATIVCDMSGVAVCSLN